MAENDNIARNGWSEYGRLVLKELERLNEGQEKLRVDFERQFRELNDKMTEFKNTEKEVDELKRWREKVTEVWSTSQMQQGKDEIYKQKGQWQRALGTIIAIQVLFGVILALLNYYKK